MKDLTQTQNYSNCRMESCYGRNYRNIRDMHFSADLGYTFRILQITPALHDKQNKQSQYDILKLEVFSSKLVLSGLLLNWPTLNIKYKMINMRCI